MEQKNPYTSPAPQFMSAKPVAAMGTPNDMLQPLINARGWLKFLGIYSIVVGAIYCISIVGLIVGWLPIWIGVLLTKAAGNLEAIHRDSTGTSARYACSNIATVFTIIGVLTLIGLLFLLMYIAFLVLMLVIGIAGAAAANS